MNITASFRSRLCSHAAFLNVTPDIPYDLMQACSQSAFILVEELEFSRKSPGNTTTTPLISEVLYKHHYTLTT
jgi:hypothetical protein